MARAPVDSEGVRYFSWAFKFRVPNNHGAPQLRKTSIGILREAVGHMVEGGDGEPLRVYRTMGCVRLVASGLENGLSANLAASTTPVRANLRRKVAFVFVRPARCRHGFARSRQALTPTAFGLMTARPSRQPRSSSECQRSVKWEPE